VGLNYTRTSIRDDDGNIISVDALGKPLSFSGTGIDDLITVSAGVTKDQRNNPVNPTQGSVLSLSTEQSIPVGNGNIFMNRVQANYSQYTPVDLLGGDKPEVLAFNVQGGTTIGDLPPYQAFNLGGINSVRGYGTGEVGSGRTYVLASAEYRVPLFNPVGAVLFADFASDLGTGDTVPGEPGIVRGKPGTGFGYGAGLRVDSPIGIIRADYGFTDQGDSQLQFGIGQRF
jgi:outer membrane protein insertion porin family